MRPTRIFPVILFVAVCSFVQAQQVKVTGKLEAARADKVEIVIDKYYLGRKTDHFHDNARPEFSLSFALDRNRFVTFRYGQDSLLLYLEPGDELNVDLTSGKPVFGGTAGANNTVWWNFQTRYGKESDEATLKAAVAASPVDVWEMEQYDRRTQMESFLKKEMQAANSPKFRNVMSLLVKYQYQNALLLWATEKALTANNGTMQKLPAVMQDDLEKGPFDNEEAMILPVFRRYLDRHVTFFTFAVNGFSKFTDRNAEYIKRYEYAEENLKGNVLSWYLGQLMVRECTLMSPSIAKRIHTELVAIDRTFFYSGIAYEKCGDWINTKEKKEEAREGDGNVGIGFVPSGKEQSGLKLKTTDGKDVYLSQFKGKVVYADIWASWCGPCRAQFPKAKELKARFKPDELKQIVFLYISIDQDETAWKNAIQQLQMEGFQTLSPGGWGAGVCEEYGVTSIPRYLLLNKQGKVVDMNAKRPGDPAVYDDLIRLIRE